MIGFVALFVAVALLLIGLAIPLLQRRIEPNGWYGLRVAATFADRDVWFEANAKSGRDLLLLGSLTLVLSLVLPLARLPEDVYVASIAGFLTLGALLCAVVGVLRAGRLLAEKRRRSGDSVLD